MLIDCDTCTVRGQGCHDCVVTVLLGAPPGWRGSDPTVVPMTRRPAAGSTREDRVPDVPDVAADLGEAWVSGPTDTPGGPGAPGLGVVVELDDVERRAVRALAEVGLVPPLRHQPPMRRDVG